jgi:hypothetical protein
MLLLKSQALAAALMKDSQATLRPSAAATEPDADVPAARHGHASVEGSVPAARVSDSLFLNLAAAAGTEDSPMMASRVVCMPGSDYRGEQVTPLLDLGGMHSSGVLEGSEDSPARRAGVLVGDVVLLENEVGVVGYVGGVQSLGGGEFLGVRLEAPWPGNPGATPWIKFGQCKEAPECDLWVPSSRVLEQVDQEVGPQPRIA